MDCCVPDQSEKSGSGAVGAVTSGLVLDQLWVRGGGADPVWSPVREARRRPPPPLAVLPEQCRI